MMAHENTRYTLENVWRIAFRDMHIAEEDVLLRAGLPLDLFKRQSATVTGAEYYQLWDALEFMLRDEPAFPLRMIQSFSTESFSPPVFACACSSNLNVALNRMAHYKPLVGPFNLAVTQTNEHTTVVFSSGLKSRATPITLIAAELTFWVNMARMATREQITPLAVYTTVALPGKEAYEDYFGVPLERGSVSSLTFAAEDAAKPFLTMNEDIWATFEPQFNKRMRDLDHEPRFGHRVRAVLMEIIASGQYSKSDVASRLGVSARTLQRRLTEEGTTYQAELNHLREQLAYNYLGKTDYSSAQIAFLLGYDDPNSFFRAFRAWTGKTPESVRADL